MFQDSDFRNTNPRFLVPLQDFRITINFNEIYLQQTEQVMLRNILSRAVVVAVGKFGDISPGDIAFGIPNPPSSPPEDGEATYAWAALNIPVYGCSIQIGQRTIQLSRSRTSVTQLIRSINFMQEIVRELIPPKLDSNSFADVFQLRNEFYRHYCTFDFRLSLGDNLFNRAKTTSTVEVAERLLRVHLEKGTRTSDAPLGGLQTEKLIRADASLIANRTLGSSQRQIALIIECPFNVVQKDIDISASCRSGFTGAPFELSHLHDLETPFLLFYRDLVLGRLFEDLFTDYAIEARL